jgi:ABC-type dipeptide/oligopeptide/nickel transport system ATPase subunit
MLKKEIVINDCNNISHASIAIFLDNLNLKYAANGTGKSTIAKAIFLSSKGNDLSELRSYGTTNDPSITIDEPFVNVFVFDEDFVNNIVFRSKEVIENSFDIFIKSPKYNERLDDLNNRLKYFRVDIRENEEISALVKILIEIDSKIQRNVDGEITKNPFFKSILSRQHLFKKVPENLQKFKPFIDTDNVIEWIDWKYKGFGFDASGDCPFCAESLNEQYQEEKTAFSSVYTKNSAKNLKELLSILESLKIYIHPEKYLILDNCIRSTTNEDEIMTVFMHFMDDVNYLKVKINGILSFDSANTKRDDIPNLDIKLKDMKINGLVLIMLNSEKTINLIDAINLKIDNLLNEVKDLGIEINKLNSLLNKLAKDAKDDINNFLDTAGISYEMEIEVLSETETKTILKYKDRHNIGYEVNKIKDHLSWGERNAFALVLFMHYAISHQADLIILDDPISSFDSDKKYAIINRLFKNNNANHTFYNKSVLMLTHDLEPVIDFVVNNRPTGGFVNSYHLCNQNGQIIETEITKNDLLSQIQIFLKIIKDESINIIIRLVALRKYIEHTLNEPSEKYAYNIISCVFHPKSRPDEKISSSEYVKMSDIEIQIGTNYIHTWLPSFSYDEILANMETSRFLVDSYKIETCSYFKLQLFRLILDFDSNRVRIQDNVLLKHIDETYHIENDYLYNLETKKFDTIPIFITKKCDEFINNNYTMK